MRSKKIGILNFYYSNKNYGAVLQAYALQYYLRNLGYDAKTLNFRNFPRRPDRILRTALITFVFSNPFKRFRRKWLRLSTPNYLWAAQLNKAILDFDTFIVGSDQVWRANPVTRFRHTAYFLSFVPKIKKRIAYAASFGIDHWAVSIKAPYTEIVKQEMKHFNSISVRESTGIDICKDVFGVKATQVLDPTLLVDRSCFDSIIGNDKKKSVCGIVYYKLDVDTDFDITISHLSHELNAVATNIYYSSMKTILGEKLFSYYEVHEWLQKIRDAELVVTDSFHCICFCILFEKEFIYYPNKKRGMTRLESLLGLLGLTERIFISSEDLKNRNDWTRPIDYLIVNNILDLERSKSDLFLKNALS
jgi:hypothetical protein